jgi:hypothetical protein
MRISAGTVIPPLLLSSVVAWSAWPSWGSRSSALPAKPKVPEIRPALLTKAEDLRREVDPFRLPVATPAKEPDRAQSKAPTSASTQPRGVPASRLPNSGPQTGATKVARKLNFFDRLSDLAEWARGQAEAAIRSQAVAQASLPGQVALSATSIRGKRRVAVINGRVYAEGDPLGGITAPSSVILSAVRPASVQLRSGLATVEIAFSATSRSTGQAPPRAAQTPAPRASKTNTGRKPTRPR